MALPLQDFFTAAPPVGLVHPFPGRRLTLIDRKERPMVLPPRDHTISRADAARLIARFHQDGAKEHGAAFQRGPIVALLSQSGCTGIRIYYARHENGTPALVLAGIDRHITDLTRIVLESDYPCPSFDAWTDAAVSALRGPAVPSRDHDISATAAGVLTRRYRETVGREKGGAFHGDQLRALLNQPGCHGLRIYLGQHSTGRLATILVGVGPNDRALTEHMMELHYPCPPVCGEYSELNS